MTSHKFNPLLDKRKRKNEGTNYSVELNAADNEVTGSVPLSPVTGRPMIKAFCRDVQVWVDPDSRLVLPMRV